MFPKFFLRAITNDGKGFDVEMRAYECALTFTIFKDLANGGIPMFQFSWIPRVWVDEVYPQFVDPNGIVSHILLMGVPAEGAVEEVINSLAPYEDETRILFRSAYDDCLEAIEKFLDRQTPRAFVFENFRSTPESEREALRIHEDLHRKFLQDEMSMDFHMGYFDAEDESRDLKILKERGKFPQIKLAPSIKGHHNHSDWHSELPMEKIQYRLYINNLPSSQIVDDISFMEQIQEAAACNKYNVNEIQGFLEMPQWLYDLIHRFFERRDFKMGAHPANEPITKENLEDMEYSLFWSHDQRDVAFIHPGNKDRDGVFDFDDINF